MVAYLDVTWLHVTVDSVCVDVAGRRSGASYASIRSKLLEMCSNVLTALTPSEARLSRPWSNQIAQASINIRGKYRAPYGEHVIMLLTWGAASRLGLRPHSAWYRPLSRMSPDV